VSFGEGDRVGAILADIPPTGPFGFLRPASEAIVIVFMVAGVVSLGLFVARRLGGKPPTAKP
jgi:hypothetical protein